jgi:hypothetical protein
MSPDGRVSAVIGKRARLKQVKEYLEKKLDFWDPAVIDILKID